MVVCVCVCVCIHTYIGQDLFGGRGLGAPTRLAWPGTPKFYFWDPLVRFVEEHVTKHVENS
jgi:hypothetical protein